MGSYLPVRGNGISRFIRRQSDGGILREEAKSAPTPYAPTTFVTVGDAGPGPPSFIGTT